MFFHVKCRNVPNSFSLRAKGCPVLGDSRVPVLDELRERLSRRQALGGVLGMAALALTAEAEAKKKKKDRTRKKKKRCKKKGNAWCSGKCRNLQADARNCGRCGFQCAEDQNCVAGVCSVPCQEFACISNQIDAKRVVSSVNAMADGDLAVLSPTRYQIVVMSTTGETVRTVGKFGTAPGELQQPLDLAVAPDGTFYIADFGAGNGAGAYIMVIPPTGTPQQVKSAETAYTRSVGYGNDKFFAADWWWMNQYDAVTLLRDDWWGYGGVHGNRFDAISGIAAGGDKIYVINGNNPDQGGNTIGKVYCFSQTLHVPVTVDWTVGGVGSGDGQFNNASGVAVSGDRLFIADTDNRRVQVLSTTDGSYLFEWTTTDRDGNEVKPESVAVHPDGTVYVTSDEMIYGYTLVS